MLCHCRSCLIVSSSRLRKQTQKASNFVCFLPSSLIEMQYAYYCITGAAKTLLRLLNRRACFEALRDRRESELEDQLISMSYKSVQIRKNERPATRQRKKRVNSISNSIDCRSVQANNVIQMIRFLLTFRKNVLVSFPSTDRKQKALQTTKTREEKDGNVNVCVLHKHKHTHVYHFVFVFETIGNTL